MCSSDLAEGGPSRDRQALVTAWHKDPQWMGLRWLLPEDLDRTLGRGAGGPWPGMLDDVAVSRHHLRLVRRRGALTCQDLDSRNGTWVNGARVEGERVLVDGDVLRVGPAVMVLRDPAGEAVIQPHPLLVGRGAAMAETLRQVALAAPRTSAVLVVGETGTGKELVARALHEGSGRTGRFVPVNCGALGEGTHTSELFGHVRGAFTGADRPSPGLVGEAEGGTLLLDEIGDAPPAVQVALLRFLQEGEVRPVGATRSVRVDVRVVAATHRALAAGPAPQGFRQDLLERLRRWVVQVPPLRERREDVPLLAEHLAARHDRAAPRLTAPLAERLCLAPWLGNVRELDGVIEQLAATRRGEAMEIVP